MNDGAIRFARNEDGPAIGKLFREADLADLGVDWGLGVQGWIVAEHEDEIIGAIQAIPGQPYGFLGDVVVSPRFQGRDQTGRGTLRKRPGDVGFSLYVLALDYLKRARSQVVLGMANDPRLIRMLRRYGAMDLGPMTLLGYDLTRWPGLSP